MGIFKWGLIQFFDVNLGKGTLASAESRDVAAGESVVSFDCGIKAGLAICHDLPVTFWRMAAAGCKVIVLPSAFSRMTGQDHWLALLRERAIETQTFVIAPKSVGAGFKPAPTDTGIGVLGGLAVGGFRGEIDGEGAAVAGRA